MTALEMIAKLQTMLEQNGGEDFELFADHDLNHLATTDLMETTTEQCEELGCDEPFVYVVVSQEL